MGEGKRKWLRVILVVGLITGVVTLGLVLDSKLRKLEVAETAAVERVEAETSSREDFKQQLDAFLAKLDARPQVLKLDGADRQGEGPVYTTVADQEALAAAAVARFRGEANAALGRVDASVERVDVWAVLRESLRRGERLTNRSDDATLGVLDAAMRSDDVSVAAVEALRSALDALVDQVDRAYAASSMYAPSAELLDRVERVAAEAETLAERAEDYVAYVGRVCDPDAEGGKPVVEAVEAYRETRRSERLARLAAARDEAQERADAAVAEAIRRNAQAAGGLESAELDAETAKLKLAAEALRTEAERRLVEREAERRYQARKAEALRPANVARLAPFFAEDYKQPDRFGGNGVESPQRSPMSLSKIQTMGALEPTQEGYRTLLWVACGNWTDRPRWNMQVQMTHINQLSSADRDMLRGVQQVLSDYGDIYVDEGKLSP